MTFWAITYIEMPEDIEDGSHGMFTKIRQNRAQCIEDMREFIEVLNVGNDMYSGLSEEDTKTAGLQPYGDWEDHEGRTMWNAECNTANWRVEFVLNEVTIEG